MVSAGAELTRFNHDDTGVAFDFIKAFGTAFEALANYEGVSFAAITGYAMGGGLECALACDIRIAEEQARMALPECTVGLLPGGLGTQHLPWLIGEGWAKRMILLGKRVSSAPALKNFSLSLARIREKFSLSALSSAMVCSRKARLSGVQVLAGGLFMVRMAVRPRFSTFNSSLMVAP